MNTPLGFVVWLAVVVGFVLGFLIVGEWLLIRREMQRAQRAAAFRREAWTALAETMHELAEETRPSR